MLNEKTNMEKIHEIDLRSYHTFGVPVLKLLFSVAFLSLIATGIYEYLNM